MEGSPLADWLTRHGAHRGTGASEPSDFGDSIAEYGAARNTVALFDATSTRDRLLVTGDDRETFLQGLCSNDVEALRPGQSVEAVFITPKGKLVADVRIVALDDALLIEGESGRAAALEELFAKYRIHERVDWSDASAHLTAIDLWGPLAARAVGVDTIPDGQSRPIELRDTAFLGVGTPFGLIAYLPAGSSEEMADALLQRALDIGGRLAGRSAIEPRRLELGLGRYGIDWDESTNPLEAGLDRALNYKKGCYVGQEVVAKATYIGHVNRRLVRLAWEGVPVPTGTPLLGGKSPGRVTSSAAVPGTPRVLALGVVRREAAIAGAVHRVGETGPEAVVTGYPLGSRDKPV